MLCVQHANLYMHIKLDLCCVFSLLTCTCTSRWTDVVFSLLTCTCTSRWTYVVCSAWKPVHAHQDGMVLCIQLANLYMYIKMDWYSAFLLQSSYTLWSWVWKISESNARFRVKLAHNTHTRKGHQALVGDLKEHRIIWDFLFLGWLREDSCLLGCDVVLLC